MEEELITESPNYEKLNLQENPFPYSPVPEDLPDVYSGQEHVKNALKATIGSAISTGKSNHLVITGKYGNGKTHTLKYAKKLVKQESDAISGYVSQPGEGFIDIYHEFVYDLGYEFFQDLAHEYLLHVIEEYDIPMEENIDSGEELEEAIDEGEVLLSDIIPPAMKDLKDKSEFADFSRAFIHLVYEDTSLYAWQWISGEGLRYEQRKEMEIHTNIDDSIKAVRAFTSIKNIMQFLDYGTVCVFIDEFEAIERLNSRQKQNVLNNLRHVIDMNPQGTSIVIGCAPEVWQEVMSEYHAFSERIGKEESLRPLDRGMAENLIQDYLETYAQDGEEVINPYTEDAVEKLLELSQGNTRQLISLCGQCLDSIVKADETEVTAQTVEKEVGR